MYLPNRSHEMNNKQHHVHKISPLQRFTDSQFIFANVVMDHQMEKSQRPVHPATGVHYFVIGDHYGYQFERKASQKIVPEPFPIGQVFLRDLSEVLNQDSGFAIDVRHAETHNDL